MSFNTKYKKFIIYYCQPDIQLTDTNDLLEIILGL
jgi:hypothetical protein